MGFSSNCSKKVLTTFSENVQNKGFAIMRQASPALKMKDMKMYIALLEIRGLESCITATLIWIFVCLLLLCCFETNPRPST